MNKEELSSIITSSMSEALDFHRQRELETLKAYRTGLKARDEFIMKKLNDCAQACTLYFYLTIYSVLIGICILIANL